MFRFRAAITLLLLAATAASAADTSQFGNLHWRLIGPFRGGRVLAVAGIPGDSRHFYFGSVGGGVWKSTMRGERGSRSSTGRRTPRSARSPWLRPPDVVYVGTGEADMRSDISFGNGVYKSSDAGRTWSLAGSPTHSRSGGSWSIPRDPNRVFVAALGHPYGPNAERGVFRSTDAGRYWKKILYRDANTGADRSRVGSLNPAVIYATLWRRGGPVERLSAVERAGGGLYRSTDGGETVGADQGKVSRRDCRPHRNRAGADRIRTGSTRSSTREKGGLYRSDEPARRGRSFPPTGVCGSAAGISAG